MSCEFESAIYKVTEWIVNYRNTIRSRPVMSSTKPGEVLSTISERAPQSGRDFDTLLRQFEKDILPGITHWQHPRFFGYFPANSSEPSLLAEMLTAALGVQGMSWITSPAATELEVRVMGWLRDAYGLDKSFHGVIQDTASTVTLLALLVARERATNFQINETGFDGKKLRCYCSAEAHSSIDKAVKAIGIGVKNLVKIPTLNNLSIDVEQLREAIVADFKAGHVPFAIIGAFGTTSTTAVDNLVVLGELAKEFNLWFHVDAAYAGNALLLPELRPLGAGINSADSIVINPHKWLMTNFDCSAFFIKDRESLLRCFSILPEYLKTNFDDVTNFRDWGLALGRRFRSLKLWFVLSWYGIEGLQTILRNHIQLAQYFETLLQSDERFEITAATQFNLVCFRLKESNAANMKLLERINKSGKVFITHTKIADVVSLRAVIGQTDVTRDDVDCLWTTLQSEM